MNKNGLNFKRRKADTGNIIRDTLINHGVDDFDSYRDVSDAGVTFTNPKNIFNMDKAFKRLEESFDKDEHIGILVDGDADGFASASLLYKGILDMNPDADVNLIVPESKSHGLGTMMQMILWERYDLVITPDASSNDKEQHQQLKNVGIDVIVLDHHIVNEPKLYTPAIMVNNQSEENLMTNKNFVGVGMSFMFMKYVAQETSYKDYINVDDYLPLLAFGQITDMSNVAEPEIRYYVQKGISLFNEHKFLSLFSEFDKSVHMVSFKIAPLVNSVARIGTLDERKSLLMAMSEHMSDEKNEVIKRRKSKKTGLMENRVFMLNEYQIEQDTLTGIKKRQDNTVKKAVDELEYLSNKEDGIIIAKIPSDISSSITGLIAGRIMGNNQSPVFVVKESNNVFTGSMRCPTSFELRSWLNDTGLVKASGHEQASGVEFSPDNIEELLEKTKNELNVVQDYISVDELYDEYNTSQAPIRLVNESISLFGGAVKEPEIGYTALPIKKTSIHQRGKVVSFSYNGLNFILFSGTDLMSYVQKETGFNSVIYIDVLGSAAKNDWGDGSPQVIIRDIAITKQNKSVPESPEDYIF